MQRFRRVGREVARLKVDEEIFLLDAERMFGLFVMRPEAITRPRGRPAGPFAAWGMGDVHRAAA